ncbi:hypothetical protein B0H11DRAFT_2096992 [Mycena galericulata]|nr:hypothetical protein B0H11DRAFT_2096992 [Mycena galericulata]
MVRWIMTSGKALAWGLATYLGRQRWAAYTETDWIAHRAGTAGEPGRPPCQYGDSARGVREGGHRRRIKLKATVLTGKGLEAETQTKNS